MHIQMNKTRHKRLAFFLIWPWPYFLMTVITIWPSPWPIIVMQKSFGRKLAVKFWNLHI